MIVYATDRPILIFDGDCAFCSQCVRWVARRLPRKLSMTPWQEADLAALDLTQQQCEDAVPWISVNGSHAAGEVAVAQLLIWQRGIWALLGRAHLLPGVAQLSGAVYRWTARNRHRLPGDTPACALPQAERDDTAA